MQWVSCASSRLTVWLQGLKVRDLSSTPVSRAILETSCSGIRLQTWRKRLNRQRVGLIVFFFFIPAVWQVQNVKPTLFFIFCGMAVISIMKCDESRNARFSAATSLLSIGGGEETVKEAFRELSNDKSQSEEVRIMAQCYLQPARPVAAGSATVAEPDFDILFPGISSIPADQILQIGFPEQQPVLHNKPGF